MDTITFFRVYARCENPKPYIELKDKDKNPWPKGCNAWINALKNTDSHICWIKIRCHEQIGYDTATVQDIAYLRSVIDNWLAHVGLLLDDFTLGRIDYDYNFRMDESIFYSLVGTMQQLSKRIMRMEKWDLVDYPTVYYHCKSRHAQLYNKEEEREAKGCVVCDVERNMCRQEVQCHSGRIKYMKREQGLARNWENWVTTEKEAEYLLTAEPVFRTGDFYSLEEAIAIVQGSSLTNCHKKRLEAMLICIHYDTMDALKSFASRNTVKKYLSMLKDLNVNPLTIPYNSDGITYIKNPFFKGKGI